MPAVLIALPTARPSCADDSERTQLFRPAQKRPTWKDVERERARSSAPAETHGSSPAPVLRLAPQPPETRGSSKPAAQLPPYLRPGFVYPEPLEGGQKHARDVKACQEGLERIRAVPKNLAALLKTPEWKGAKIVGTVPSPEVGPAETALAAASARLEAAAREIASLDDRIANAPSQHVRGTLEASRISMSKARDQRSKTVAECEERLSYVRAAEWLLVKHPSGTELRIRPEWASK